MKKRGTPALQSGKAQGTVQVCGFALDAHRRTAVSLTENKKIVASAAVLAFSRLSRAEQIKLCAEVRTRTDPKAPAGA